MRGVLNFAGTLPEHICRNLLNFAATLPELCRKDKRSLWLNYSETCWNLAGTMEEPSSGFMSLGDRLKCDKLWRNLLELAGTLPELCRNFAGTLQELCRTSAGTLPELLRQRTFQIY
jgi:hypothetical protein